MAFVAVIALIAGLSFGVGYLSRTWTAVLGPALLWAIIFGLAAMRGLGDSEHTTGEAVLFWVVFLLAPGTIGTALGVAAGKLVARSRARRAG